MSQRAVEATLRQLDEEGKPPDVLRAKELALVYGLSCLHDAAIGLDHSDLQKSALLQARLYRGASSEAGKIVAAMEAKRNGVQPNVLESAVWPSATSPPRPQKSAKKHAR